MFPNPQDVLPLPPRPDLPQYRRRGKELLEATRSGRPAVEAWSADWVEVLLRHQPARAQPDFDAARYARALADFAETRLAPPHANLAGAQFVIARVHGFASWTKLVRHIESLAASESSEAVFERAVDAVVSGDLETLGAVIASHPSIVRARSTREHGATLLHYTSANGVENYRQQTPANVVAIARALLAAGAEVDAEADVYGGGATPLGLVVTSAHPRRMGVQNALADLLLEHGARLDPGLLRDCLANGCPEAAVHLATRGIPMGLEVAAGVGRLDVLGRLLENRDTRDPAEMAAALLMAGWYGRLAAARVLLDAGVDPAAGAPDDRRTALHVAAYQGHSELVRLLISRGAPVDAIDERFRTTPLVWALHAWLVGRRPDADAYRATVRALLDGGARVDASWLDDERLRADASLFSLLEAHARRA